MKRNEKVFVLGYQRVSLVPTWPVPWPVHLRRHLRFGCGRAWTRFMTYFGLHPVPQYRRPCDLTAGAVQHAD